MAPGMAAAPGHGQVALGTKTVARGPHTRSPHGQRHFNWELHNINWERLNINCVCYCDQNSENNSEYKTLVHMYCCEDSGGYSSEHLREHFEIFDIDKNICDAHSFVSQKDRSRICVLCIVCVKMMQILNA